MMAEMMNQELKQSLNNLLDEAMENAVLALQQMLNIEIELSGINLELCQADNKLHIFKRGHQFSSLLLTELMGQMSGASFLLLEKHEEEKIGRMAGKAMAMPYEKASEEMRKGILLELDNILSAAFITKLANHLGVSVFGGVPSLLDIDQQEVERLVNDLESPNNIVLTYQASLKAEEAEIAPVFFWVFEEGVLEKLEQAG